MESSDLPPATAQLSRPTAEAPLAPPVHACSPATAHTAIKNMKRAAAAPPSSPTAASPPSPAAASPPSPVAASPTVASPAAGRAVVALAVAKRKKAARSGLKKVVRRMEIITRRRQAMAQATFREGATASGGAAAGEGATTSGGAAFGGNTSEEAVHVAVQLP
nr:uncharacterized protein LOC127339932 [Lolium perenne]